MSFSAEIPLFRSEPSTYINLSGTYCREVKIHGYYLDGRAFHDGHSTDLPDFATFSFGLDLWAPAGWGGAGAGVMATYIVDRYGQAYISFAGSVSAGAVPVTLAYSEGYLNKWSGTGQVASPRS